MSIECKEFSYKAGRCSGFPECCIQFYQEAWATPDGWSWNEEETSWKRLYFNQLPKIGYVPCPACFASKRAIVVKRCSITCGCPIGDNLITIRIVEELVGILFPRAEKSTS